MTFVDDDDDRDDEDDREPDDDSNYVPWNLFIRWTREHEIKNNFKTKNKKPEKKRATEECKIINRGH